MLFKSRPMPHKESTSFFYPKMTSRLCIFTFIFSMLNFVLFVSQVKSIEPCPLQSISTPFQSLENEQTAMTITDEDFQCIVSERQQGKAGFHHNIDLTPMKPASENAVLNWSMLSKEERSHLVHKQEEMFRQGKIALIVMAGGEATRFGGPKPFVLVADTLGEFLEIKVANLNWMCKRYGSTVPLYVLSSEKRLQEFKSALAERHYYGLDKNNFRWFVQGTVDTFIPTDEELKANFKEEELATYLTYAHALYQANPDGIYRFNGERRKVPGGHFDAIAAFIISGLLSEALNLGIEFAPIVNIDNLQGILKNDGMIAYFAEQNVDVGFLLAEKNLHFSIMDRLTGKVIQNKIIVRFREGILSFDGVQEFTQEAEKEGYKFVLNSAEKTIEVYLVATGQLIETKVNIKAEIGGTLVQPTNEQGEAIGKPIMKEGFELPANFDHSNAPFFNTNTIIVNLRSLLKFLDVSQEQLAKMNFDERSGLVREKLVKQIKANFEFKNHEVEGEYPLLGFVKNGKTKIPVIQLTRIMLQAAHIQGAKVGYIFAPRASVFAPVKEPEDKQSAAANHHNTLKNFTLYVN